MKEISKTVIRWGDVLKEKGSFMTYESVVS
jgi:hypothetical protein